MRNLRVDDAKVTLLYDSFVNTFPLGCKKGKNDNDAKVTLLYDSFINTFPLGYKKEKNDK